MSSRAFRKDGYEVIVMEKQLAYLKEKYERLNISNRQLIVWGMGNTLAMHANALMTEGIGVEAFTDSFATSNNDDDEKTIISLDDIKKIFTNPLIIVAVLNKNVIDDIYSLLDKKGLEYIGIKDFFLGKNADIIMNNAENLADERSKDVYFKVLKKRYMGETDYSDVCEDNQYYAVAEFQKCIDEEEYIDCGAYIGDSMEEYLTYMKKLPRKYYAIEPDDINYEKLEKNMNRMAMEYGVKRDTFVAIHAGVGDVSKTMYFEEKADSSSKFSYSQTDKTMRIIALDDEFSNNKISTIKADVETFEPLLLRGARNLIVNQRPNLAICIYHNISDMYTIIDWVIKLNVGYKIYVRHHSDCEFETVMYATCN